MLHWIKRTILVVTICCACSFSGCITTESYHDGSGKDWIKEQVEKGYLTQEEADELIKQEMDANK